MFDLNEYDSRFDSHFDRVARIDRDSWKAFAPEWSSPTIGRGPVLIARAQKLIVSARNFVRPVADHAERNYS